MRERRAEMLRGRSGFVRFASRDRASARGVAQETMERVRDAVKLRY